MTPSETVMLVRYVKACCPAAQIDEYTPDAWHDLLGDLDLADCRAAVVAVAQRQPFVAPSEIRAEVRRIRSDRLARTPLPAPPADATDKPGRYQQIVRANVERIADGFVARGAIEGAPLPGEPPAEYVKAREALPDAEPPKPDPRDVAREQVRESRARREGRKPDQEAS